MGKRGKKMDEMMDRKKESLIKKFVYNTLAVKLCQRVTIAHVINLKPIQNIYAGGLKCQRLHVSLLVIGVRPKFILLIFC
jgi:hypothetical protein